MPIVCACAYTLSPAQGIISYSSSSPGTLDPQYDRAPSSPLLSIATEEGEVMVVVVVVVSQSRMFSREKRNGEGENSILFTSFNIAAYCESCSRLRI